MRRFFYIIAGLLCLTACQSESLTIKQAQNLVENHLEIHPEYESTTFKIGEIKLSYRKDADKITLIQQLTKDGYFSIEESKNKKKFLSKDSLWISTIGLEQPAAKYVVSQQKHKVELQTYHYVLQDESEVSLKIDKNTKATLSVQLAKQPTPFAKLGNDNHPNTTFITKSFDLKYVQEKGWEVK